MALLTRIWPNRNFPPTSENGGRNGCVMKVVSSKLRVLIMLALFLGSLSQAESASVVIDGSFDDWKDIHAIYANPALPPGVTSGAPGVSFIKTYQDDVYVYFCYATYNPTGGDGVIAFDLDHNSDPRATYATMSAEASWVLGGSVLDGPDVMHTPPTAASWSEPGNPGYEWFEWCFYRDQILTDGTPLFPSPGDEVWFTVGRQGSVLASSQVTTFTMDLIPVPEPQVFVLMTLAGLAGLVRRRK